MRYPSAIRYLYSFLNFEQLPFEYRREFNLERMRTLLSWFDFPDRAFSSILIAGTKGKGSTASFLSSMLTQNRYRAGLYTSPHLSDPRERIKIGTRSISKSDFARLMMQIKRVVEPRKTLFRSKGPATFFEIFTLLSVLYFAEQKVDFGLFEVGMGGRLDATNMLKPLLSIITSVSFDHEEHLGHSLRLITREKAAIIKPYGISVIGRQGIEAKRVIRSQIRKQRGRSYFLGSDFKVWNEKISLGGGRFHFRFGRESLFGLQIKQLGRVQIENAAVALGALFALVRFYHIPFSRKAARTGLRQAFWPGRFEVIKWKGRTVVLDGAHNGASMKAFSGALNELFPGRKPVFILGTSREKNLNL